MHSLFGTPPDRLYLPLSYEEARQEIGMETADLLQLFLFLPEFEQKILSVLDDVRSTGKILFIYGSSGIGKTTFLNSLKYRSFLPIRDVIEVSGYRLENTSPSAAKTDTLFEQIHRIAEEDSRYTDKSKKTCLILSVLEHLEGEDEGAIRKFFMNLNGLLRQYPLLIFWQVNVKEDLDKMLFYARSIATTLTSRRLEYLEFTGPKQDDFPEVIRKNVSAIYQGKDITDFQLHDGDLIYALDKLRGRKREEQTIRKYIEIVLDIWENRFDYVKDLQESIPGNMELWIILCHPEAEELVDRSTRRSRRTEDYYNVDYAALDDYIKGSRKRSAQWQQGELALALSIIKTKIMFIGTHAFVNAVAAYGPQVSGFPLTPAQVREWNLPVEYYQPRRVALFLARSPLLRQLALRSTRSGNWSRGNKMVEVAISQATDIFRTINDRISSKSNKWSDQPFNRALMLAIKESYNNPLESTDLPEDRAELDFQAEVTHPHIGLRPDIFIVNKEDNKNICIEMHYTISTQQSQIIGYTLDKLKDYWDQVKHLYRQPRLL